MQPLNASTLEVLGRWLPVEGTGRLRALDEVLVLMLVIVVVSTARGLEKDGGHEESVVCFIAMRHQAII